jgi:drug/metabolite transporter (DMT)-like permease
VAANLETRPADVGSFAASVAYLGVACTAGAFLGWTWAQARMSAIHGAILLALEPVVTYLLAAWLLDERLGPRGIAGGVFVLAGIAVAELRWGGGRRPAPDSNPGEDAVS